MHCKQLKSYDLSSIDLVLDAFGMAIAHECDYPSNSECCNMATVILLEVFETSEELFRAFIHM